jgi:predicted transcriptional regulator
MTIDSKFITDLSVIKEDNKRKPMRQSKLESYENILQVLVSKSLPLENMAYEINVDCDVLKQRLHFLMKNGLVEERLSRRKTSYALTERGTAVLKALNFEKYLLKIKNTIRTLDDALQILPDISERDFNSREKAEG